MNKTTKLAAILALVVIFCASAAFAQTDPGVQSGVRKGTFDGISVSPGTTLINPNNDPNGFTAFFADGLSRFQEIEDVSTNNNSNVANVGLGPRFNFNQCAGCHSQPAVGGTGAAVNPQFAAFGSCANEGDLSVTNVSTVTSGQSLPTPAQKGTIICNNTNTVPSFITANGPTREARFPFLLNANGTVNTTVPRLASPKTCSPSWADPDAGTCTSLAQPNFAAAEAAGNIIFRIPTPLFGVGLIENLDDSTLLKNQAGKSRQQLWHCRHFQSQRQRRHHHPLWMEGAEQIAAHLFWRGLQRGDGHHQPLCSTTKNRCRKKSC